jgi:neurotransmitter:Na+ symporter, NSS family
MLRETYATRFGFILGILGGSIGMANIWRFSYMAGTNGGSAFFIPYIIALICVGLPAIMMELAYGRHFRGGPVDAHSRSGLPFGKQLGTLVMCLSALGFSYYLVLVSWTLKYFFAALTSSFWSAVPKEYFEDYVHNGTQRFAFHFIAVAFCASVAMLGIRKGLEPVTKFMMIIFFLLIAGLALHSLTLPGMKEAMHFLFFPNLSEITPTIWLMALGQVFTSVGIGGIVLVTYGSYMPSEFDIPKTAWLIILGDTTASILCGIVIFPVIFTIGAEPTAGIGLVFFTLPSMFSQIAGGQIIGLLFFTGFLFAALSTGLFIIEYLSEPLIYVLKWSRRRSVLTVGVGLWLAGIPWCYNIDWLTMLDLFNVLAARPLYSLLVPIGFLWIYSVHKAHAEVNLNSTLPVGAWWRYWAKFGLPIAIAVIYISGVWQLLTS